MDPHWAPKRAERGKEGVWGGGHSLMDPHWAPKRAEMGKEGGWGGKLKWGGGAVAPQSADREKMDVGWREV